MYKIVSELLLYGDMDKDSILMQISDIFRCMEEGSQTADILRTRVFGQIKRLLQTATDYAFDRNLWHNYLTFLLITNENPFSITCEKTGAKDGSVNYFAKNDFRAFQELFHFDFSGIEEKLGIDCFSRISDYKAIGKPELMYNKNVSEKVRDLSAKLETAKDENEFFDMVTDFYRAYGVGMFGLNKAFRIEECGNNDIRFRAINNMDKVVLSDLVGYEIRSYEGMFLAGYACELMSQDENTTLGYSASMSEFSVRTAINAYALGAKYANPAAQVQVAWANSWYDVDLETQCAQSLIDAGIKYMGMEASSPAIPETCEKNGAYVVGYHNDLSALAPDAVVCSFVWNFAPIFEQIMTSVADGTVSSDDFYYEGGECAQLTEFADFVPEEVQTAVADLKAKIDSGEVQIYGGELKDNEGNVLVAEGEVMPDEEIIQQEFLVENVIGSWK